MITSSPSAIALVGDWTGCTHWRCTRPFELLAQMGVNAAIADKDDPGVTGVVHFFDAVILPRMSWDDHESAQRFISALHRAGVCVIGEYDDDLFSPEINKRIHLLDPEASPELLEQRRLDRLRALRLMDGVTVSSPRLATVMRSLVDYPVQVVPNAIDLDWWRQQLARERRAIPGPTIGWAGGTRPDDDVVPMAQAWGRIAARFPQVNFICYGYQPEAFTAAVPAERLYRIPCGRSPSMRGRS
jgi:glycosyltransferase involved in cell wall biosynthesis